MVALVVDWRSPFLIMITEVVRVIVKLTATDWILQMVHCMSAPGCLIDKPEAY